MTDIPTVERRRPTADDARDVAAALIVLWFLWVFASQDGGRDPYYLADFGMVALPLGAILATRLPRHPGLVAATSAALGAGGLLAFAFAQDRSNFIVDALVFGSLPVAALAGAQLASSKRGRAGLLVLIGMSAVVWNWRALLLWWTWVDGGSQPRWELLSWHNQSGILSVAFAAWGLGTAVSAPAKWRWPASGIAALGIAGAWLSSSRGVILLGLGALVAVVFLAAQTRALRERALPAVVATLLGAGLVLGLQATLPAETGNPVASRDESAVGNARARTDHWRAAASMFASDPLTGTGPGSFRAVMSSHNPETGVLTAYAHNEWLEAMAEGGIVLAGPLALAVAAGLVLSVRRLRAEAPDWTTGAVWAGAAACFVAIAVHASIDFDFRYPTVALVGAMSLGVLLPTRPASPGRGAMATTLTIVPALSLVALGVWGQSIEERPPIDVGDLETSAAPWDTRSRTGTIAALGDLGRHEEAQALAASLTRWNPGDPFVRTTEALAEYRAGALDGRGLRAVLEVPPTTLNTWASVAEALVAGDDLDDAREVALVATDFLPTYRAWGAESTVGRAWNVLAEVAFRTDGCEEAEAVVRRAIATDFDAFGQATTRLMEAQAARCGPTSD